VSVRCILHAALLGALGSGALAAQEPPPGTIHGVVTDASTDSAVGDATVLLVGTPLTATTDARGVFLLSGIAPGRYGVRVLAMGYAPELRQGVVPGGASLRIVMRRVDLQLPGVVVTAAGSAQDVGESAVSVAVQTRAETMAHNVLEVDEALPFVPGVVMNHGDLDIRGSKGIALGVGSRVLVLLDGHPVLSGDGGEVNFEALPLLDLDRTEVVKGAHSALYGSAALGGVVNLITTPIGEHPATTVKVHYGQYDTPAPFRFTTDRLALRGVDVQHERRVGGIGVRLAAGRETSDGYEQNGQYARWLFRAKVTSPAGSAHPWNGYAVVTSLDGGHFMLWRDSTHRYEVAPAALGDWDRTVNLLVGGSLAAVASSGAALHVEPYVTHTAVKDHFHDNWDFHNATRMGTNIRLALNPGRRHALTAGVDGSGTALNSSYFGVKWISDLAPYAQEEWTLAAPLRATVGARLDYHHADGAGAELSLNPKVGVSYAPSVGFAARASLGRGYRAPSAIEQFVPAVYQGFRLVPNPALRGEHSWSGEVGATVSRGRFWLDAALFQSTYDQLIGPAAAPGQVGTFWFQNVQRARVRGADVAVKLGLLPRRVDLDVNYLLLDTRILGDSNPQLVGQPLPYRSRHTVTASLDLLGGLAGVDVRYRSRVESVLVYTLDRRTAITLVDLRAGIRVAGMTVLLKVSNLLQRQYVDVLERNPGPPRSFLVTALANL
jgi:outer membrane receptor protein involved in Fe transport